MSNVFIQVTGVGPQYQDGSVEIYTVRQLPFHVTKEWVDAQGKYPEVGDTLKLADEGELLIVIPSTQLQGELTGEPAQKKTDGGEGSSGGLAVSQHRYRARPTEVTAFEIVSVAAENNTDGSLNLALSNGANEIATAPMISRMTPEPGDYWVEQPDGYIYLNPKEVFERKYEPVTE